MPGAMHFTPAPVAPCDDCRHRALCGASGLICESFAAFVEGDGCRGSSAWQQLPRIPQKRLTARARKADAALAADEVAQVERLEKRAYMKAWRDRNRESVRRQGRARYRRLKASDPQRLAKMQARVRAWARSHPESGRESSRRWAHEHREQVRERRRAHPESTAAARAWRLLHLERCRELNRIWKRLNREKVNGQRRARYAADPHRALETQRRWRAEHRDRLNQRLRERRRERGELFKLIEPGKNRYDDRRAGDLPPNRKAAADAAGLSDHQLKQAMQLAGERSAQNTNAHAPGLPAV